MQERVVSRVARTQVCTDLNQHVELHDEVLETKLFFCLGFFFPPFLQKVMLYKGVVLTQDNAGGTKNN